MDGKKCIFVIEDEIVVQQSLVENLTKNGFEVFAFDSAEQGLDSDMLEYADAVIMDIRLPGIDGWQATSLIKNRYSAMPVIMLTAYNDISYRIQGFETGADDYLIKPFFMEELIARIRAVLRRYEMVPGKKNFFEVDNLSIDLRSKTVTRDEQKIKLSLTEFKLLTLLAEEQGNPVSKEEIMQKVWKGRYSVGDNTIEVYINLLRNKIDRPFSDKLIHTKPGFGYYLSKND
jgi:two-component system, OmpR family, copper resistance phosphate regulon response regulator CusR